MLMFDSEEVEPILASQKIPCTACQKRSSPWKAALKGQEEKVPLCGWCVMYAGSQWGHDNREELLHVGRTCVGMAAQHNKPVPHLDERGRLAPPDAERYMMGIAFTSRMFRRPLARIARKAHGDDA